MSTPPWWKTAVFYQIYPRSFADGNGDGVGDLPGILEHLDHLVALGVDAVWLSPFYRSPMHDFGYDISDHCDVDPTFGTLDDIDAVIAGCHERGLRIIVDYVPNHVSSDHPWFVASRSSRDDPKRDWFIWLDPRPGGGPPTNWTAAFTKTSAWEWDEPTGQYYLHLFLKEQPDVNWANPQLAQAQLDVMRFWLARGVDGFRIDVVNAVGKDPEPRDVPDELVGSDHVLLTHHPPAHDHIRRMRATADAGGDTMLIGEVVTPDPAKQAEYQGDGDELQLCVNFASVWARWDARVWRDLVEQMEAAFPHDSPRWPSYVLSNHDFARHRTRFGGSEARARAAAVLLLGLRGTPFLYQGEELGLEDADVPPERVVDPGGRDGCRAPVPWLVQDGHGWGAGTWLPFAPCAAARSAEAQRDDPGSVLALYSRLLSARRASPALQVGALELLDHLPEAVLGWRREDVSGDRRTVLVNFGDSPVDLGDAAQPAAVVEVASDGAGEGLAFDGRLGAAAAVVLRP